MDVFVARQAIFDRALRVYGYELLYRSSQRNSFDGASDALASSRVILNSFFAPFDVQSFLGDKQGFLNLSRELLLSGAATLLPAGQVVIEILETVRPDAEILQACLTLKKSGYILALDDFTPQPGIECLVELADIIKVDVLATPVSAQKEWMQRYGRADLCWLAEKIETPEALEEARRLGYDYFQGYFFARPVVVRGRAIPSTKINSLRILKALHRPDLDLEELERIIRQDVALSYRLLRYLNSPLFGWRARISSVRQALVMLGESNLRKWATLGALSEMSEDKPAELLANAVVRAFFAEALGRRAGLAVRHEDLFLLGLFSHLDALMDQPLEAVLADLALAPDLAQALLNPAAEGNRLAAVYRLVLAYEHGQWDDVPRLAQPLGLPHPQLSEWYLEAVTASNDALEAHSPQPCSA